MPYHLNTSNAFHYPPKMKLGEGKVFTPVCQSFCSGGGGCGEGVCGTRGCVVKGVCGDGIGEGV